MKDFLSTLGLKDKNAGTSTGQNFIENRSSKLITSHTPSDGSEIGSVYETTKEDYEQVVKASQEAFKEWRMMPAPLRGEIVRQIGLKLREYKEPLGKLVSYEMGKIYQEGLGEVQEMIDICDFAVGQSRMLYGKTMHSERPQHRMYEQWHPLGPVGIISAFNFPVAVYSWNAMIAAICGDTVIWKGSEKTPLCSVAVQNIIGEVLKEKFPELHIVALEPADSPILSGGSPGPHKIQGIGAGFVPEILNTDIFDEVMEISTEKSYEYARRAAREEGILGGVSSGAAIYAAIQQAEKLGSGKKVVAVIPSNGERYLSTPLYQFED